MEPTLNPPFGESVEIYPEPEAYTDYVITESGRPNNLMILYKLMG